MMIMNGFSVEISKVSSELGAASLTENNVGVVPVFLSLVKKTEVLRFEAEILEELA